MNPEFETYELIDRYLNKQLSGQELEAFRNKMLTDQDFSELVDAQRMANELIISEQLTGLKQRMKADFEAGRDKSGFSKGLLGLLVAGAIGVGAGVYFYSSENKAPVERVVTESTSQQVVVENSKEETVNPVIKETKSLPVVTKEAPKDVVVAKSENATTVLSVAKEEEKKVSVPSISQAPVVKHVGTSEVEKPKETVKSKPQATEVIASQSESKAAQENETPVTKPQKIDEVFMPGHGELWKVPLSSATLGATVRFFNKAGAVVREVNVPSGEIFEWDGKGNHGEDLDTGRYLFVAEYADGKQQKGYISLIR